MLVLLGLGRLSAAPVVEQLSRGVVAVHQPDGKVFVSWRLLSSDPDGTAFNLYRETAPGPVTAAFGANAAHRPREGMRVTFNGERGRIEGPRLFRRRSLSYGGQGGPARRDASPPPREPSSARALEKL